MAQWQRIILTVAAARRRSSSYWRELRSSFSEEIIWSISSFWSRRILRGFAADRGSEIRIRVRLVFRGEAPPFLFRRTEKNILCRPCCAVNRVFAGRDTEETSSPRRHNSTPVSQNHYTYKNAKRIAGGRSETAILLNQVPMEGNAKRLLPFFRKEPCAIRIKWMRGDRRRQGTRFACRRSESVARRAQMLDHSDDCCPPNVRLLRRRRLASNLVMLRGLRCRSHRWDAAHLQ